MRILAVADLHYQLQQFDWLLEQAPQFDLVIIAGDMLDLAGHADLDAQIVVVGKYLDRLRRLVPVLACSGNHDGDVRNEQDEMVAEWLTLSGAENLTVDGQSLEAGGDLFTVCPWWDGPETRATFEKWIEEEDTKPRKRWIWVYHSPPQDSPLSWTSKKFAGDPFLNELIDRYHPDLVIGGHIHNAPFMPEGSWIHRRGRTWAFNPGHVFGSEPAYLILDLDKMDAKWISYEGEREASLD